ncbi:putative sulfate/molybdate transporter [Acuticoccus sediminis]|uniref:putative sulfate/molybdate transporter n=1 Tax=Acuticoccus sediminis TaxID=2184697 RepID=UPI001CFE1EBF|nr:putative sulfate/molybdate transporter [Acuticoccus sediminis]
MPETQSQARVATRFPARPQLLGDVSGAFGDLGTLLPYVVPALVAGILSPTPVFAGFAAGYALVAVVYRVPIAVQPMKALGAAILAGGLASRDIAWAGAIIGAVLLLLSATPLLERAARLIPQSVVTGLQVGLGLGLALVGFAAIRADPLTGAAALAVLGLTFVVPRGPWALLVVLGGILLGGGAVAPVSVAAAPSLQAAILGGVVPQLPLTLMNAVIVAAAVARSFYGAAAHRVTERRLAATSGLLNLALVPFGAMPMCHGAGGIAAHHRFGARTALAPTAIALAAGAAALAGDEMVRLLAGIPSGVAGALLFWAAAELSFSRRLFDARPDCRPVIAAAAIGTVAAGATVGLLAGVAAEGVRAHVARQARRKAERTDRRRQT